MGLILLCTRPNGPWSMGDVMNSFNLLLFPCYIKRADQSSSVLGGICPLMNGASVKLICGIRTHSGGGLYFYDLYVVCKVHTLRLHVCLIV